MLTCRETRVQQGIAPTHVSDRHRIRLFGRPNIHTLGTVVLKVQLIAHRNQRFLLGIGILVIDKCRQIQFCGCGRVVNGQESVGVPLKLIVLVAIEAFGWTCFQVRPSSHVAGVIPIGFTVLPRVQESEVVANLEMERQ